VGNQRKRTSKACRGGCSVASWPWKHQSRTPVLQCSLLLPRPHPRSLPLGPHQPSWGNQHMRKPGVCPGGGIVASWPCLAHRTARPTVLLLSHPLHHMLHPPCVGNQRKRTSKACRGGCIVASLPLMHQSHKPSLQCSLLLRQPHRQSLPLEPHQPSWGNHHKRMPRACPGEGIVVS